ncbi:MAG: extracellular solute-binding protein [Defluviitaleaceae bacterium]|nr:extracellular solute-binding protein [Defluviitaleaceae bacterium]MCL2835820.1 extracellular solute-binding protein [Defluviitaleaceae bacterium]
MKSMKKLLVAVTAVMLAFTMVLSACGSGTRDDGDDRYTITILTVSHSGEIIASDHPAILALEEHTGYRIELFYVLNADYDAQMNTRLTDDLPGLVVITGNTGPIVQAAQSGAFWDITDYIMEYPNLAEINQNVFNNISIGGRYFGIPRMRPVGRPGMVYRSDWLENVGLEEPTTLDELYEVLYAFTNNDPNGDGSATFGMAWTGFHMGPFHDLAVMHGAPNRFGVDEEGQLYPWFEHEGFIEALDFSKKLYDEGLINTDFAALQTSDWAHFLRRSEAGWHMDVTDESRRAANGLRDNGIITQEDVDAGTHIWVMGSVANRHGELLVRAHDGHMGYVAISTTGARTEEDLRHHLNFLNMLNDEIGQNILIWGAEDVNYEWVDDETILVIPRAEILNGWDIVEGLNQFRMRDDLTYRQWRNPREVRHDEVQVENIEFAVYNPILPFAVMSPTWTLSMRSLNQIIDDAVVNYVMGNIDLAGFGLETARWYAEGGQDSLDELQVAFDEVNTIEE